MVKNLRLKNRLLLIVPTPLILALILLIVIFYLGCGAPVTNDRPPQLIEITFKNASEEVQTEYYPYNNFYIKESNHCTKIGDRKSYETVGFFCNTVSVILVEKRRATK